MKRLKRSVIKEELVALTGDYKDAIILNQFIYWSERVRDFDKYIKEEKERCRNHGLDNNQEFTKGWIFKKAEELSEETMLGLSKSNMRKHIKSLIEKGWLDERLNPIYRWDKTKQYRVNLKKVQQDLLNLGYSLEGYTIVINENNNENNSENNNDGDKPSSKTEQASSKTETPSFKIELAENEEVNQDLKQNSEINGTKQASSKTELYSNQSRTAIPEITTEITKDIFSQSVSHEEGRIDEKEILTECLNFVQAFYEGEDEKILTQSLIDIITSNKQIKNHDKYTRIKNANKLLDIDLMNCALNKLKTCTKKINNPQGYFTTILYNLAFEFSAVNAMNKKESTKKNIYQNTNNYNNTNKFHNFNQRTDSYTPEELKEIGKRNFKRKLKQIGI